MSDTIQPAVPNHVGFIVDGNRRWARAHGVSIVEGHRAGYKNMKHVLDAALGSGVKYVSMYAFSTENWHRSKEEVAQLMKLFMWIFTHELAEIKKRNVRIKVVGNRDRISARLRKAVEQAELETQDFTAGTLILCLDYGGQDDIVRVVRQLVADGTDPQTIEAEDITHQYDSEGVPPVDLIVRTSGEQRLSNFMLWQAAYSELIFTDTLWPDFSSSEFQSMLGEYAMRHRRFGT